jgi:hypothetical protein
MSRFTDLFQEPAPAPEPGFSENVSDCDAIKFERPAPTPKSSQKKTTSK